MSQPVFYTSSPWRKEEFALDTYIYESGGKLTAVKKPLSEKGLKHMRQMGKAYDQLKSIKKLTGLVNVVLAKLSGDGLAFDYVEGVGLDRQLLEAIAGNDEQAAAKIIDGIIAIVDSLDATSVNPTQNSGYGTVFGKAYGKKQACVSPALVDLNPDNFIVDGAGRWNFFDYEWVFDFPVPKEYLVRRFLFWFFCARYQDAVLLARNKTPLHEIGQDIYVPSFVVARYKDYFLNMKEFLEAEASFQAYVNGSPQDFSRFKFFSEPKPANRDKLDKLADAKTNNLRQYDELEQAHGQLQAEYDALNQRMQDILSSKAYRYARRLQKAKGRLTK